MDRFRQCTEPHRHCRFQSLFCLCLFCCCLSFSSSIFVCLHFLLLSFFPKFQFLTFHLGGEHQRRSEGTAAQLVVRTDAKLVGGQRTEAGDGDRGGQRLGGQHCNKKRWEKKVELFPLLILSIRVSTTNHRVKNIKKNLTQSNNSPHL